MSRRFGFWLVVFVVFGVFFTSKVSLISAYTTNMSASVVIGQQNFTSNSTDQGGSVAANTLQAAHSAFVYQGKLIVSDRGNNRVLIYNQVPTTNNVSADVVIGQQNFTSDSQNQGGSAAANTLNNPHHAMVAEGKLIVSDALNNRVLIYNQIPTTNNVSADVVIGQQNFTSSSVNQGGSVGANTLRSPFSTTYVEGKLIIHDRLNNRVLIYNSIPTTNNASADVVIGQQNFTSSSVNQGGSVGANTIGSSTTSSLYVQGKLFISDGGNNRILVFNSIPTTNNASASYVLGQQNFTSNSANQGGTAGANTMRNSIGITTDGERLFLADDNNHRILIFNTIPTSTNASADIVLGQANFSSVSANQGGSVGANTMNFPLFQFNYNDTLIVPEFSNNRVLIFYNVATEPSITINNIPQGIGNNQLRFTGTAYANDPYNVGRVEYSLNGGGWNQASSTDGSFDSTEEEYYFDIDPVANAVTDSSGNTLDGYTIQVRTQNTNGEYSNKVFVFQPFNLVSPANNALLDTNYPQFEFTVNKQLSIMRDNLEKYQVYVRQGDGDWQVLIDSIPIDQSGNYETDDFFATYSDNASRIQIWSKTNPILGSFQWKVVAVDKSGHSQETGTRNVYAPVTAGSFVNNGFPLALLFITGVGDPLLNSYDPVVGNTTFFTSSSDPTFYGIAWSGSQVTLTLNDQDCEIDATCNFIYTATANGESRFGINIPPGDLIFGHRYTVYLSTALGDQYTALTPFTLVIGAAPVASIATTPESTGSAELAPTVQPPRTQPPVAPEDVSLGTVGEDVAELFAGIPDFLQNLPRAVLSFVSQLPEAVAPVSGALVLAAVPVLSFLGVASQLGGQLTPKVATRILQALSILPVGNPQGLVFDSKTLRSVPFALLTITTTQAGGTPITETVVSDTHGVYHGVKLPKAEYLLTASRQEYLFPTKQPRPKYLTLKEYYKGEQFQVTSPEHLQLFLIPIDPVSQQKGFSPLTLGKLALNRFAQFSQYLTIPLAALSGYLAYAFPSLINYAAFGLSALMVLNKVRQWLKLPSISGQVVDKAGKPVTQAVVRLSNQLTNDLVSVTTTDDQGRFKIFDHHGLYQLNLTKPDYLWIQDGTPAMSLYEVDTRKKRQSLDLTMQRADSISNYSTLLSS